MSKITFSYEHYLPTQVSIWHMEITCVIFVLYISECLGNIYRLSTVKNTNENGYALERGSVLKVSSLHFWVVDWSTLVVGDWYLGTVYQSYFQWMLDLWRREQYIVLEHWWPTLCNNPEDQTSQPNHGSSLRSQISYIITYKQFFLCIWQSDNFLLDGEYLFAE